MTYFTVAPFRAESEVRRSRFIAIAGRAKSEEELFAALAAIKKEFALCTHVCYGAVLDPTGNRARFSDDGEPGGTAGAPILEAIRAAGLAETYVAVVRYFGGVKLGTGGLSRAYAGAAARAIAGAKRIKCEECDVYRLTCDFAKFGRLKNAAAKAGITVLGAEYAEAVRAEIALSRGANAEKAAADILDERPRLEYCGVRTIESEEK